jgi:GTP-binding protein HflX
MTEGQIPAIVLSPEEDTREILALAASAGHAVVRTFVQKRENPDPEYYVGAGKVKEIADFVASLEKIKPNVAIFNGTLKPPQVFHLEKALGIPIFDRTRLILEIFEKRARSPEARLQVELAHLHYNLPLVKEYIHRTRTGEHPGLFFAGGAYQVDEYHEMIKRRMARIKRELETIRKERAQRRKTRRRGGLALLALAGYTNAGKSALFRALSDEESTIVGEELFTTLSTSTRRLKSRVQGSNVLVTDTVGFIQNLPVWLVESFMSTLEEVFLSDAVILLLDLSDGPDEMASKLATTLSILRKGPREVPIIAAFNKADLLDVHEREGRIANILSTQNLPLHCTISALTGEGLKELVRTALVSLEDFFFGRITGPPAALYRLARDEGISPGPCAEPRATAEDVLLRNWRRDAISKKYPELEFKREEAAGRKAAGSRDGDGGNGQQAERQQAAGNDD